MVGVAPPLGKRENFDRANLHLHETSLGSPQREFTAQSQSWTESRPADGALRTYPERLNTSRFRLCFRAATSSVAVIGLSLPLRVSPYHAAFEFDVLLFQVERSHNAKANIFESTIFGVNRSDSYSRGPLRQLSYAIQSSTCESVHSQSPSRTPAPIWVRHRRCSLRERTGFDLDCPLRAVV